MNLNNLFYVFLFLIFFHLFFYQIKNLNIKDAKNCLKIFKSNNFLGFIVLTSILLGNFKK